MSFNKRARHRHLQLVLTAILAGPSLVAGLVSPAMAECNPSGADTSFIRTAPYARRIVVGRVVDARPDPDGQGQAQDGVTFTLEVQRVLRGPSISELPVDRLETGGCIRWLSAADGDLIALAFDTRGGKPDLATATAAWIEGRPRVSDPYEVLTMVEVLGALSAPRPPDTATAEVERSPAPASGLVVWATVVGSLAMLLVIGRRSSASRRPRGPRRGP